MGLGMSFSRKDEKQEEDKELRITVTGGLPDYTPDGPTLHIGHPQPEALAKAYADRASAIEECEKANRKLTEINDQIRTLESNYTPKTASILL